VVRIAVAATAPFGAEVLEELAGRHEVAYLLTQPDRPRGRGRKVAAPPAKEVAERLGILVRQPERLGTDFDPEVETVVTVAYGQLVPRGALERARWLNVHLSLLPRWRGAAPVERALMAGDEETGVSVIDLVEELDAGPIAAQRRFPIGPDDDAGAVFGHARGLTPDLVEAAMANRRPAPQGAEGVTYAAKIAPADRELDWSRSPQELHNRIRALSPHIGARGSVEGRPVIVWRSRLVDGKLELFEVQAEGRRRMTYDEFLRGLHR
jgi:methionyl-tRNA formyltransferase